MRFRLLRRRLTISAPSMSVRSAMPWPLRWAALAVVLGFCGAIGLWAFEFGKDIAGLDKGSKEQLLQLRTELVALKSELQKTQEERDRAQSIANTAGTLVTTEKTTQERLVQQVKQLEADNRSLRNDLGFFEKLIPANGAEGVSIRGLQAEVLNSEALKWQVLVLQSNRNTGEFKGTLELTFTGIQNGKSWTASLPNGPQAFKIGQYGRIEGVFELPPQVIAKGVVAKVMEGNVLRASHTIKL